MNSSEPEDLPERVREGMRDAGGDRSSRYQRLEELGRGGMAIVYRAWDIELNRTVALKVIREEAVPIPTVLERFQREAETAARLAHPNIVAVHDVGEEGGRPYLVMELVEGETLDRILRSREREIPELLPLLVRVACGVAFAHQSGIVHRDLKPANILVANSGEPKVADFGLAHLMNPEMLLTQSGTVVGTPSYMAPEQVRGRSHEITARTDVYALGAILYEILTGVPPHQGSTALEVFGKIVEQEPKPPRLLKPALSRELESICLKALEKEPSRRYASAKEFGEDLQRYLEDETIVARPPGLLRKLVRRLKRHKTVSATVALLLLFSVGLGSASLLRSRIRAAEHRRLLREAEEALRAKRWDQAALLFSKAQSLAPEDPAVHSRRRAAEEMARALGAFADRDAARLRARAIRLPSVSATDPASAKEKRYELESLLAKEEREAYSREQAGEHAALAALAFDPDLSEARRVLAELYFERRAFASSDRALADWWERQMLVYGGPSYLERLLTLVTLGSHPPGARIHLFRYEERKGRLFPVPVGTDADASIPSADALSPEASAEERSRARDGTAYPLRTGTGNEVASPLRLRPGSYLLVLRREGFADARVPVAFRQGGEERLEVTLLPPAEIPRGFAYVPAGRYFSGGDPAVEDHTTRPRPREVRALLGYFIARFAVTCGEYLAFVNDREYLTESAAAVHVPASEKGSSLWRATSGVYALPQAVPPDHPVSYVRRSDAEAYAKWYTRKFGQGAWTFRLPSEDEWEMAARGADGRFFPWGDRFDPAFVDSAERHVQIGETHGPSVTRIGLFPANESPYGVRDMAGVMSSWTSTDAGEGAITKGGAFSTLSLGCRAAARRVFLAHHRNHAIGFRLAASIPNR